MEIQWHFRYIPPFGPTKCMQGLKGCPTRRSGTFFLHSKRCKIFFHTGNSIHLMEVLTLLKPWETHITNRSHSQAFLLTVHEKQPQSRNHTYKKLLNQSRWTEALAKCLGEVVPKYSLKPREKSSTVIHLSLTSRVQLMISTIRWIHYNSRIVCS